MAIDPDWTSEELQQEARAAWRDVADIARTNVEKGIAKEIQRLGFTTPEEWDAYVDSIPPSELPSFLKRLLKGGK